MQEPFYIKKIGVLGAGVMGAQIAAHCVNAGFETLLYDLFKSQEEPNALVNNSVKNLFKLKPSPLATAQTANLLQRKNYENNLSELAECDLIIEAIAEQLDLKVNLYQKIASILNEQSILVTNTSGLSIDALANALPENMRARFCGVHFFNPPRYMHLAELIPSKMTSDSLLDHLETWLTRYLGKGVVRAKDTPNFIANRIGVFSLLSTMRHAEAMGIPCDEVDALTGILLGRPKSATFRTMDVVGLDTMAHVVDTMHQQLDDDPWHHIFVLPNWINELIDKGSLGQKTGAGVYRKRGTTIEVYDASAHEYRSLQGLIDPEVKHIFQTQDEKHRLTTLAQSNNSQARFLMACFYDLFHYCAFHLKKIAHTVRDVDLAMRWGFGWSEGPFETWQKSGVADIRHLLERALDEKNTLSQVKLPSWVQGLRGFYSEQGAYSPESQHAEPRSQLPVYQRQFFPERVLNEPVTKSETLYENDGVRLWHLKNEVAVVSFKSKANTINQAVLDGLNKAIDVAERQYQGLILYQHDEHNFSSGADLRRVAELIHKKEFSALEEMIAAFQQVAQRLKYSCIPTVAALRGRALGGGCELLLHCDRVLASFESYPGLVEAGVGLIPAGGGCKEMALRAAHQSQDADLTAFIKPIFERIATAFVAGSAPEAQACGYLLEKDGWVMHKNEVLYGALHLIDSLQAQNYTPPLQGLFKVVGKEGRARIQVGLINWLEGGFISQHDYFLAERLVYVLSGGDVNEYEMVDEAWLLALEREAFLTLAATEKTQARIGHLLETGKPLRN